MDRLFDGLETRGLSPWLDRRKLLPGQNWPRAIEEAIETSDFFIACFSRLSVPRRVVSGGDPLCARLRAAGPSR